jgi:hypothetical protein
MLSHNTLRKNEVDIYFETKIFLKSIQYLGMCGKIGEGPSKSKPTAVTDNPIIIIKVPWLYLPTNQPQKGLEIAELTEVIRNSSPSCIGPN